MYFDELRATARRVFLITIGVVLVTTAISAWPEGSPALPRLLRNNLLIGTCIGGLFWIAGPVIEAVAKRLSPRGQWGFRLVAWSLVFNAGIAGGLAALAAIGTFPWNQYASQVWGAFVPGTLINAICCTAYTIHEGLKYQMRYEVAQARLQSLEARLRPHFLFNSLNSIVALIPEDPATAERVTVKLADLLRYSLDSGHRSTVTLEQELKVTSDYLEIERTRFGERLRYSMDVASPLLQVQVPPFCLQTLVENSVKYGGDQIRIRAENGAGTLVLTVWDSGQGFDGQCQEIPGHGLHDLRKRLAALWGGNAGLRYREEAGGTAVEISIPSKR